MAGVTRTVKASGGGDYTTIAAGMAASGAGDFLHVYRGTYAEGDLQRVAVDVWFIVPPSERGLVILDATGFTNAIKLYTGQLLQGFEIFGSDDDLVTGAGSTRLFHVWDCNLHSGGLDGFGHGISRFKGLSTILRNHVWDVPGKGIMDGAVVGDLPLVGANRVHDVGDEAIGAPQSRVERNTVARAGGANAIYGKVAIDNIAVQDGGSSTAGIRATSFSAGNNPFGYATPWGAGVAGTGVGDQAIDPEFEDLAGSDFHLTASSPESLRTDGSLGATVTLDNEGVAYDVPGSRGAFQWVSPDSTPPVVLFSSGSTSPTRAYTLTGTVTDAVGDITAVLRLNGDAWVALPLSGGATSKTFSVAIVLRYGRNTLAVDATDNAGNVGRGQLSVEVPEPPAGLTRPETLWHLLPETMRQRDE